MRKRVLVTGACGFVGQYMCEYLCGLEDRPEVVGTDIIASETKACDVFYKVDLSSSTESAELISKNRPDYVIHLAGTFGTNDSQEVYRANLLSATALLEAVRIHKSDAVVTIAGSAAEYGNVVAEQLPVMENVLCQPLTNYGLSKLLATQAALYYHRVHSLNVMIVRPFQLIGKGVTDRLAPGAFAEQLKRAISARLNVIKVGNLETSRDFLDVHDMVEAIWMLCCKPAGGEIFNLCSGIATKMSQLLAIMIGCTGVSVEVEVDISRLRGTTDVNSIYGNYEKLQNHCGWKPKTPLETSICSMFK